jgi:DNA-binding IclR family transcriptional regulator
MNGSALIQDIVEGSQAVRVGGLHVGFMGHTHLRASGKILLAFIDENQLEDYVSSADFGPLTPSSIRSASGLRKQLRSIREQGYALDQGEFADGVTCIAAPVFAIESGAIAALTISAPTSRYMQNAGKYVEAVVQVAKSTSSVFGYSAGDPKNAAQMDTQAGRRSRIPRQQAY